MILFGSSGYLGADFFSTLSKRNIEVRAFSAATTSWADLLNIPTTENEVIINCAGYTGKPNVDACEVNKANTLRGNVLWAQKLTDFCILKNLQLLHISSGCIYDGYKQNPYTEDDAPNFTFDNLKASFYSGSKALAEEIVSQCKKSWICRLRIPFDDQLNPRNYIIKILKYKKLLNLPNSISNKKEFINACIDIIQQQKEYGKYNITNSGAITAKEITEILKKYKVKKDFSFFEDEEEFNSLFGKRSNCILSNSKLLGAGIHMSDVTESVERSIQILSQNYDLNKL